MSRQYTKVATKLPSTIWLAVSRMKLRSRRRPSWEKATAETEALKHTQRPTSLAPCTLISTVAGRSRRHRQGLCFAYLLKPMPRG